MEELRKVFLEAEVPEDKIDGIIKNLELKSVNDLKYYKDAKDYAEAGVESKLAQRKLMEYAQELKAAEEAQKQNAIEAKKAEAQRIAEEEQNKAKVAVLKEIYVDNESWVESLRQLGILEFDSRTYIAGIKAVLAANLGVFDAIPELFHMINDFAVENAKSVPKSFYTLQRILAMRKGGLVVAAARDDAVYDGVPIYATAEDMADLIQRMHEFFIPSILESAKVVACWDKLYSAQSQDTFFRSQIGSRTKTTQYPSPAPIHESGQNLRININRTFAGNGIQKALAICNEYEAFVKVLNDPVLPQSVGAVDRDSVLIKLGFDANAAVIRSEKLIINFVLNMITADQCPQGDELQYCEELCNIVKQIDWSGLTGNSDDADLVVNFQSSIPAAGATMQMALGTNAYAMEIARQIQQMNGQPASLEVGTGIGSGREC